MKLTPHKTPWICAILFMLTGSLCSAQPDLIVDLNYLQSTIFIDGSYDAEECEFEEGCVGSAGVIKALRFGTRSMNIGNQDVIMGNPLSNPDFFEFHACHQHYHFGTFANYELFDLECNSLGLGHKLGFCLMNSETIEGDLPSCEKCSRSISCGGYNCGYQGLGAGCADTYGQFLDCQLLDLTNIPNGRYYFKISLNFEQQLPESDYSNNAVFLLIDIQGTTLDILYAAYGDPNDVLIEDLDDKVFPDNVFPSVAIATDTLEIRGNTTVNDALDREIIAGRKIRILPGFGRVAISADQGGSTHLGIAPCLLPDTSTMQSDANFTAAAPAGLQSHGMPDQEVDRDAFHYPVVLKIYPNPAPRRQFTVALPSAEEEQADLLIYNTDGRLILQEKVSGLSETTLDLSRQAKGIYLLHLRTAKQLQSAKVAVF